MGRKNSFDSGFWRDPSGGSGQKSTNELRSVGPSTNYVTREKPVLRTRERIAVYLIAGGLAGSIIFALIWPI